MDTGFMKNDYSVLCDNSVQVPYNFIGGMIPPGDPQHELMTVHYRDIRVAAIREFEDSFDEEIYEAMAWDHLTNEARAVITDKINQFRNYHPSCL